MSVWAIIFWIVIALIVYAFREFFWAVAAFIGAFMGVGALLFWWWFDSPGWGANVGFILAILIGLRGVQQKLGARYGTFFELVYYVISYLTVWIPNRLQLILTGPWRYIFKYVRISNSTRETLRPVLYVVEILLYIVTTPLRLLNAILYNMVIYAVTELYDLICEVIFPNNYNEGKGSIWKWTLWFPVRLIEYPIYHGSLAIIEGCIWTVIDIFIPTITMYHGTDLESAQAIVGSRKRNKSLRQNRLAGTFKASSSENGWAGLGVYFAPARQTAIGYAARYGGVPVMIACRVSLGKILNIDLAPTYVEANVGGNGVHAELNRYAERNGYTTSEWWNHSYWEYCMFDWQNSYNELWRIRPIYVLNLRTGLAQHIDGGSRHWFFSEAVFEEFTKGRRNTILFYFAIFVTSLFIPFSFFEHKWVFSRFMMLFKSKPVKEYVVSEPVESSTIVNEPTVDDNVNKQTDYNSFYKEPTKPATPKPVYTPPARNSNKSYGSRTTNTAPTQSQQPMSKHGFRLEKVDKIPSQEDFGNKKKSGYRLEKVDRIPTKDNPTDKNKVIDDVYYY